MTATRLLTLIRHDARLQYRYGIYIAYAFVVGFYIAVLVGTGSFMPEWVPGFIIFSDPAAVGFFFLGALMMLEKSEGVRVALAVTPVSAVEYLAAKTLTLTGLALVATAILLFFVHTPSNVPLLMATVALASLMYVGIGVPLALRFRTVNGYIVGSAALLFPVIGPGLFALLEPTPTWLLVIPAAAQLKLILVAVGSGEASAGEIAFMLAVSFLAAFGALWLALRFLRREFGR